jgi:hypothetical protein
MLILKGLSKVMMRKHLQVRATVYSNHTVNEVLGTKVNYA